MGINYRALVEDYRRGGFDEETGKPKADRVLRESFQKGHVRVRDFDLGRLWEECFGYSNFRQCKEDTDGRNCLATKTLIAGLSAPLTEDIGVSTAAFQNISGQIVYSAVIPRYTDEEFVFTRKIPEMPSKYLGLEKIAGLSRIGRKAMIRNETQPYALAGIGENWIHAPPTDDRGLIVPVTREAIFEDRTGQIVEFAGEVGYTIGLDVEIRAVDAFIDLNETAITALSGGHRYHWKDNSIATYGDNSGTHSWDNLSASTPLVDWTSVQAAELLAAAIVDPFTGQPVVITPKEIVVAPTLLHTAKAIVRATENRLQVGGYATTGNLVTRVSPNTIPSYDIVSSRQLAARTTNGSGAQTTWYLSNIGQSLKRKVNWPMDVVMAPPMNHEEFTRQIVMQWRANERSAFFWVDPRYSIKATA
jgi:hypothetical protein